MKKKFQKNTPPKKIEKNFKKYPQKINNPPKKSEKCPPQKK